MSESDDGEPVGPIVCPSLCHCLVVTLFVALKWLPMAVMSVVKSVCGEVSAWNLRLCHAPYCAGDGVESAPGGVGTLVLSGSVYCSD